ncbi:MAG: sortase [bacterium]
MRDRHTYFPSRGFRAVLSRHPAISVGLTFAVTSTVLFGMANAGYIVRRTRLAVAPPDAVEVSDRALDDSALKSLLGSTDRILVPSLYIDAPIVSATERSERAYQLALRDGVAHLPGTPEVGDFGNAYLFGHSSDFPLTPGDYKTVFATLSDVEPGAAVYVTDGLGNAYRYLVTGTAVVSPKDLSVTGQPKERKRMLTLQTSYPVGTALRRFVVTAELDAEILVR